LDPFFNSFDTEFSYLRTKFKEILQEEAELNEIVQLVGRDSLSEDQKLVLEVAKIIREDYLQQDAFSNYDYNCPLYKSSGMMRCIICYYEDARKTILESSGEKKITWALIYTHSKDQFVKLSQMKFQDPK